MKVFIFLMLISVGYFLQKEISITHHRKDLQGKKWLINKNFIINKLPGENNMDMINRGYDSVKFHAAKLDADLVYINGRRWRYLGRKLVIITEIYQNK